MGSSGLVFEPALDSGAGVWHNIGLHHAPADFARSVVEALSGRLAVMARNIAADGGSQSPLFVRTVFEMIGVPVRVTTASPVVGAARMAVQAAAQSRSQ